MISVCFYFEVHQPFRLRPYSFFNIGQSDYFDDTLNRQVVRKVGDKCYLPANEVLFRLIRKYGEDFKCTFSISGVALEQFRLWYPEVLDSFRKLADTGCVEFLAETYYHSLSGLYSEREFREQVGRQIQTVRDELGVTPVSFRNTELIYNNHIAYLAQQMGFRTILAEGARQILGWRSPNFVYRPKHSPGLRAMLKNYRLSDDIAFRFSEKSWSEHPLSAEKFARWVHAHAGNGKVVNLFMDYETFGEHQWKETGIFEFLSALPEYVRRHPDFKFRTVTDAAVRNEPVGEIDVDEPVSWADTERDLSAWRGNSIQHEALKALYEMEDDVRATGSEILLDTYRKLQTSDHFYYMCTKYFNDGDVHKYFSPYNSPYDAYVYYMNVLQDFRERVRSALARIPRETAQAV